MPRVHGDPPGLLHVEETPAERSHDARRGAYGDDIPVQSRNSRHIRCTEGALQAGAVGRAHLV